MKSASVFSALFLFLFFALTSCDPGYVGPYEEDSRTYGLSDFDRLDIGSAFQITVKPGSTFSIEARGNRQDLEDLEIYTRSGTLHAEYRNNRRNRRYDLFLTITMPTVRSVSFSGASRSTLTGFQNLRELDVVLSGASRSTVDVDADRLNLDLSGASDLDLEGSADDLRAELSGASILSAFDFPVADAELELSGASSGRVRVSQMLDVTASGASIVRYRGQPTLRTRLSGNSTVRED